MKQKIRIVPGYARLWFRRNWWRAFACAGWIAAGMIIRHAVASTRLESWPIGGEIIPMAICWGFALCVALGERSALKRGEAKKKQEKESCRKSQTF